MEGGGGLNERILESMATMQQFMLEMRTRMDRLEEHVSKVRQEVHAPEPSSPIPSQSEPFPPSNIPRLGDETDGPMHPIDVRDHSPGLSLHIASDIETMWYTDRPFPPFVLEIHDERGEIYTKADEWEIVIHLVDGYGRFADDKLGQNERSRRVVTHKGTVTVAGLRFYAVSSKNGGHFNLAFEVKSPREYGEQIPGVNTHNITILSCRLYHNPKAPLSRLRPEDSLSMMPGIGRLYAQRFLGIGINTIGKLAEINLESMTNTEQQSLLDSLRRDKGTMTKAKLEEYINQARDVLQRAHDDAPASPSHSPASPSPKRQRLTGSFSPQEHSMVAQFAPSPAALGVSALTQNRQAREQWPGPIPSIAVTPSHAPMPETWGKLPSLPVPMAPQTRSRGLSNASISSDTFRDLDSLTNTAQMAVEEPEREIRTRDRRSSSVSKYFTFDAEAPGPGQSNAGHGELHDDGDRS